MAGMGNNIALVDDIETQALIEPECAAVLFKHLDAGITAAQFAGEPVDLIHEKRADPPVAIVRKGGEHVDVIAVGYLQFQLD